MRNYFVKVRAPHQSFFCDCTSETLEAVINAAFDIFGICSVTVMTR